MSDIGIPFDYEDARFPRCPHCGCQHRDYWDGFPLDDEASQEVYCDRCSEPFWIQAAVTLTWSMATTEDRLKDGEYGPHEGDE